MDYSLSRFDLTGRAAVITGGGTGVGKQTALLMASQGADVMVAGRRQDMLDETVAAVEALGGKAIAVSADVRREEECHRIIDSAVAQFGRIDVLVNNAGGSRIAREGGWTAKDWQDMIDLNLTSVWNLSRFAAPHLAEHGQGTIVNVSSVSSWSPMPNHAPYGAAKAGVNNLTLSLAAEYASQRIRVNCVAIGLVASEGYVKGMKMLGRDPDDQGERIAFGRPGEPIEVAFPILFLATPASSYITGETVFIGGGPRGWSKVEATA
jgi:NAD(P)-dependent dehydrogenase (short-subunit alcohol dehydrogenase family)